MPNKTTSVKSSKSFCSKLSRTTEATDLLEADQDAVKKLFRRYGRINDSMDSEQELELSSQIGQELSVHAQIEEEIFTQHYVRYWTIRTSSMRRLWNTTAPSN
jgi:hypothetical protein